MGTDIHLVVETRARAGAPWSERDGIRVWRDRNYDVFAILTGTVRNGHGFAGVPTSRGFRGIVSEPRGWPDDVSFDADNHPGMGDHSASWLTADEIDAFDWDQVTTKFGVVPMRAKDIAFGDTAADDTYETWHARSPRVAPNSYCGGVSGRGIYTITDAQADLVLADPSKTHAFQGESLFTPARPIVWDGVDTPGRWNVRVSWEQTYRKSATRFLEWFAEHVYPLGKLSDTRLVFNFDS